MVNQFILKKSINLNKRQAYGFSIYAYDTQKILKGKDNSRVQPEYKSKTLFAVDSEQTFAVCSDKRTVLGIRFDSLTHFRTIVIEELSFAGSRRRLPLLNKFMSNIILHEELDTFLLGNNQGELLQFGLSTGRSSIRLQRKYSLGSETPVTCYAKCKNLIALGASDGKIRFWT